MSVVYHWRVHILSESEKVKGTKFLEDSATTVILRLVINNLHVDEDTHDKW